MSAFSNLFAPKPAAAPAPQAAPQQQQQQQGNSGTGLQAPVNPVDANGQMPGSKQEPVNPLDAYKGMLDNANKATDNAPPQFNLPQDKLSEIAGKMNFTQSLPQELQARIASGDGAAMMEAINLVGQQVYSSSMLHSSSLTDTYVNARLAHDSKNLGSSVKEHLTESALSSNPAFQHPVARKQLTDIAKQMAKLHPDATPAQIAESSLQFMQDMASSLKPAEVAVTGAAAGEVDWDAYFDGKKQ